MARDVLTVAWQLMKRRKFATAIKLLEDRLEIAYAPVDDRRHGEESGILTEIARFINSYDPCHDPSNPEKKDDNKEICWWTVTIQHPAKIGSQFPL